MYRQRKFNPKWAKFQPCSLTRWEPHPNAASFGAPTTTSMYIDASKTVLLQTARALVYNPSAPQSTLEIRVVLDAGSQRSYVTRHVKNALKLKSKGEQCLSIATFGSDKKDARNCEVVKIGMRVKNGPDKELKLLTVPTICSSLTPQPIMLCVEKYHHLSWLDLADFTDGKTTMDIDMLIGADYYWEFATGRIHRGKSGPVAIHTQLGWVLSGPAPPTERCQQSVNLITTHILHVGVEPCEAEALDSTLRSFWELESLGLKEPDRSVHEQFEENVKFRMVDTKSPYHGKIHTHCCQIITSCV